jgi:hypothetical protein
MKGAANSVDDDESVVVDCTRVRSIPPSARHLVLQTLYNHEATFHAFLQIMFVVQQLDDDTATYQHHPLRLFHGMQDCILSNVAAFAGVSGASLANVRHAAIVLEELIEAEEEEQQRHVDMDDDGHENEDGHDEDATASDEGSLADEEDPMDETDDDDEDDDEEGAVMDDNNDDDDDDTDADDDIEA